eukprot:PITA_15445
MGHYAVVCPEKKKKKGKNQSVAASTEVEDFADRFDREFGSLRGSTLVQDNLQTGQRKVVRAVGVGTLTFQRESKPPLKVSDVLYVPGMRKNLISVSALEDRGYKVLFRGGQMLMYLRGTPADSARVIGVSHVKVYKFAFQSLLASSSSTDNRASSSELCEIWHRRMGHMYHGALRTLQEITTGVPDFSTDYFDTCRGCAMGKFAKSPFPSRDNRETGILDLIHSDVSGWMSHVSLSGYEYYVLFMMITPGGPGFIS